jgi:hypothetical protein
MQPPQQPGGLQECGRQLVLCGSPSMSHSCFSSAPPKSGMSRASHSCWSPAALPRVVQDARDSPVDSEEDTVPKSTENSNVAIIMSPPPSDVPLPSLTKSSEHQSPLWLQGTLAKSTGDRRRMSSRSA